MGRGARGARQLARLRLYVNRPPARPPTERPGRAAVASTITDSLPLTPVWIVRVAWQPAVKGHMHHPAMIHHPGSSAGSGGGGSGGAGGAGGAMVPVPGPPMDEKQVKRAELVESPTTRLAFKVERDCVWSICWLIWCKSTDLN